MKPEKSSKKKFKDFESALGRLEEITAKLESGEVSLEESISLYSEGMEIAAYCSEKLAEAEKKITVLQKKNAELIEVPFEDENITEVGEEAEEDE